MEEMEKFLRELPKVELHVHLESTMPGELLEKFAARHGRQLPRPGRELYQCSAEDLSDFLAFLDKICSYVAEPAELTAVAEGFSHSCRAENIRYAEAILNPTHWPQFSVPEIVEAVTEGFDRGQSAGGADCRFTLSLSRDQTAEEAMDLVETMIRCRTPRLVGLSIDGNEALSGRTGERFRPAFLAAGAPGFGRTVHAGESSGPEGVRDALDLLAADRLDHGVRGGGGPGAAAPPGRGAGAVERVSDLQPDAAVPPAGGASPPSTPGRRRGGDAEPGRSHVLRRPDADGGAWPGGGLCPDDPGGADGLSGDGHFHGLLLGGDPGGPSRGAGIVPGGPSVTGDGRGA